MNPPRFCPACGVDNQGKPIPLVHREAYGGSTHFLKWVGRYDRDLDRTVAYVCSSCQHEIKR